MVHESVPNTMTEADNGAASLQTADEDSNMPNADLAGYKRSARG